MVHTVRLMGPALERAGLFDLTLEVVLIIVEYFRQPQLLDLIEIWCFLSVALIYIWSK